MLGVAVIFPVLQYRLMNLLPETPMWIFQQVCEGKSFSSQFNSNFCTASSDIALMELHRANPKNQLQQIL